MKAKTTTVITQAQAGTFVIARNDLKLQRRKGWQPEEWARMKALSVVAWLHEVAVIDGEPMCAVTPIGVHGLIDSRIFDGGALYFMPNGSVEWNKQSFPNYAAACF